MRRSVLSRSLEVEELPRCRSESHPSGLSGSRDEPPRQPFGFEHARKKPFGRTLREPHLSTQVKGCSRCLQVEQVQVRVASSDLRHDGERLGEDPVGQCPREARASSGSRAPARRVEAARTGLRADRPLLRLPLGRRGSTSTRLCTTSADVVQSGGRPAAPRREAGRPAGRPRQQAFAATDLQGRGRRSRIARARTCPRALAEARAVPTSRLLAR